MIQPVAPDQPNLLGQMHHKIHDVAKVGLLCRPVIVGHQEMHLTLHQMLEDLLQGASHAAEEEEGQESKVKR